MPVNDFAVPRMDPSSSAQCSPSRRCATGNGYSSAKSKPDAIRGGSRASQQTPADLQTVAGFLDAYFERHLRLAGIRSLDTATGRIKTLKRYFGELPVKAQEDASIINRSRATPNTRAGSRSPRCTRCWRSCVPPSAGGQARTPPLIEESPFRALVKQFKSIFTVH
jgi:hypothetical protein